MAGKSGKGKSPADINDLDRYTVDSVEESESSSLPSSPPSSASSSSTLGESDDLVAKPSGKRVSKKK